MITAVIQVKVTPEAKLGYNGIARIISEFKEVEAVYLMSGGYDFSVMVNCADMKQVGKFVSKKISAIKGVASTGTHFIMERYKHSGEILDVFEEEDDRGLFTI